MSNSREAYNLKKMQKLNKIDQTYDTSSLKDMIIKPEKLEEKKKDIDGLVKSRRIDGKKELEDSIKKRTNMPYKGVLNNVLLKDSDYKKDFKKVEDLVVHKVSNEDKRHFEEDIQKFSKKIQTQDKEIGDVYSKDKETENKKKFEYQHKYKYRGKVDVDVDADLRTDRIEFYKKEQEKMEDSKKKIDDILISLIDTGVLSENLENINYDKINVDELEKTLIKEFGEEEFTKLMSEIKI
jgi:hypothetical protein